MDFANAQTTNFLLVVLTLVSLAQFALLVAVIVAMRAAAGRAKVAMTMLVGNDVHQIHGRFSRLLNDVETLVTRANSVLGAVERGAHDLGNAASMVGHKAQKALALGSSEIYAVSSAVKTGMSLLKQALAWRNPGNGRPVGVTAKRFE